MTKILMVCLGNICRSPLAEGILKAKLNPTKFYVDSAGTSGFHDGELPDPRSIKVAKANGIDIENQRSRLFVKADFEIFHHIFVMDISNYENVLKLAKSDAERAKVRLILDHIHPNAKLEVPDPYHDAIEGFNRVYEMLDEACSCIAEELNSV